MYVNSTKNHVLKHTATRRGRHETPLRGVQSKLKIIPSAAKRYFVALRRVAVPFMAWFPYCFPSQFTARASPMMETPSVMRPSRAIA